MAYSKSLADRVGAVLGRERGIAQKKMFGGVGFLLYGNMCVAVWQDSLIVRVGPEEHVAALARPFARPFDITGRPMAGWVMVEPDGLDADRDLRGWIDRGLAFAGSLTPKRNSRSGQ